MDAQKKARFEASLDQIAADMRDRDDTITISTLELSIVITMAYIGSLHEAERRTESEELAHKLAHKIDEVCDGIPHFEEFVVAFAAIVAQDRFKDLIVY